jgi:hypothetical protein
MRARTLCLIGIICLAAVARIVPHPPNFAPITAMALFAGAYFASPLLAILVPLAAVFLSDIALQMLGGRGLYTGWLATGQGLYSSMWVQYLIWVAIACFGMLLQKRRTVLNIAVAGLASSVFFFLASNFGVWALDALYPHTPAGLADCFVAALPFFRETFLGDLVFVPVLFGGFALAEHYIPALRAEPATTRGS